MSDADEESRRMATRSGRNNSGASSSSSSTAPTTLRVVASTVTEPTLNMPTTPAQLTEMIASAVATALTNQQPVNRDLFNTAASGSISNASIGTQNKNLGGHIFRPINCRSYEKRQPSCRFEFQPRNCLSNCWKQSTLEVPHSMRFQPNQKWWRVL